MKKIALVVVVLLLAVSGVAAFRAIRFESKQIEVKPLPKIQIDASEIAESLSKAIQFRTVSEQDPQKSDKDQFLKLHDYLRTRFPRAHRNLKREIVADSSLLFFWQGTSVDLDPMMLTGHLDVVPADTTNWEHPPFDGVIRDDYVWGRGSMDDKASVISILHAVEALLASGATPRRSIYLAFGSDEEIGGLQGAANMAKLLQQRGVRLEYVLDEGLVIVKDMVPGLARPVAMIGIAEKGYLTLQLTVETTGGHSSMPEKGSSIEIISNAILRLQNRPFRARMEGPALRFFEYLGPEMALAHRVMLSNLWLTEPAVKFLLARSPASAAIIRTTTAVTMVDAGVKENVMPTAATAVVNFRIQPGDSIDGVIRRVAEIIDDPRVHVTKLHNFNSEPSAVSDVNHPSFSVIQKTIAQVFPGVLVSPALVPGGTDAKHYQILTNNIYRFAPMRMEVEDRARFHGVNERISVKNLEEMVNFYFQLLKNSSEESAAL